MFELRSLFNREALVRRLTALPVLTTPIMDLVFGGRPQVPFAFVSADMVLSTARAQPVVRRGGRSHNVGTPGGSIAMYEPLPISLDVFVAAADLLTLQQLDKTSLETWATERTDFLRRSIRATTEGICAQALSGKIEWPIQVEGGGFDTYEVDWGSPLSVVPGALWSAAGTKLKSVFETLMHMRKALREQGYGGQVEIWAGEAAFRALFGIAEASSSTAQMKVVLDDSQITVGTSVVKLRNETYWHPQLKTMLPVVPTGVVRMIATDAGHKMPYCALDDLDAKLQALPMFVKPIKKDNPSGYELLGMSKPFPIPNMLGVCDAVVVE